MRSSTLISALSAVALAGAQGTDAPVVASNPAGAAFAATLPNRNDTALRGTVSAASGPKGQGVDFAVSVSGLPATGGPFLYHIHAKPVPADGNCTGAAAHLDPYNRGEDPPCNSTAKQSCQTGDLSGKYGKINGSSFSATYNDLYTATDAKNPSFFGNLSIVFHYANKTRISCANFTAIGLPSPSGSPVPSSNATLGLYPTATGTGGAGASEPSGSSGTTPPVPSAPQSTGGASVTSMSLGAVGGMMAMILFL